MNRITLKKISVANIEKETKKNLSSISKKYVKLTLDTCVYCVLNWLSQFFSPTPRILSPWVECFVKSLRGWLSSIFESDVFFLQLRPCYLLDENQTLCRLQGTQGRRICTQKKLLRQGTSVLKQELVSEIILPNPDGSYRFISNQGGLDEFHSN